MKKARGRQVISIARKGAIALATLCAGALALAAPASAEFGIESFRTNTHAPDGRHVNQAGAHADSTMSFRLRTKVLEGEEIPDGALKDVVVDLPAGFAGNPQAVPQCTPVQFVNLFAGGCPPATQVGISHTHVPDGSGEIGKPPNVFRSPVYNLVPADGETAVFGFYVAFVPVQIKISVRSGSDYGLRATVSNISTGATVFGQDLTLWGVPADPAHDHERMADYTRASWGAPAGVEPKPFLTLPPTCPGPMRVVMRARAWRSTEWVTATDITTNPDTGEPEGPQNCDKVPFDARLTMKPSDTRAGAPAPYTTKVNARFDDTPLGIGNAHVKDVRVTLPEGVAISPSSADGLDGCSPEQLKLGSEQDPTCPNASKIGQVQVRTPVLPGPLTGSVYLRRPTRDQLFHIAIVARGYGVTIKLPGEIYPDHRTGQVVAEFKNNPQLPFTDLTVRFKGGPRAPLTNPRTCGTYTTTTTITSWAGHSRTSTDSFAIDKGPDGGPCRELGFEPSFRAGMVDPTAGGSSTFSLVFGRSDGDQDLRDVTVQMPEGVTGRLALVEQCPDHLAVSGTCGEASRIGSVTVGSGAGSNPFFLPGRVYLTGPYRGAPLGMSIVVPAIAGPFDLGTVVVRAAVHVDKRSAALRVVSDPMPTILEGVPLRVRTVNVRIDRDGFMINPTNCRAKQIDGTLASVAGATAQRRARFAAANCRGLPIKPRMMLRVGARGLTRRFAITPLTVTLRQVAEEGNLKLARVTLPKYLASRPEVVNVRVSCSLEQYEAERCPMQVGTAVAVTPLLRRPMRGDVFLVRHPERRLPDMMVRLKGQGDARGIVIDLTGKITIGRNLLLTTSFDTVPDVPVSRFVIRLTSGRNGPIATNRSLCVRSTRRQRARLVFRGQNGRLVQRQQKLRIRGCGRAAARRSGASARGAGKAAAGSTTKVVSVRR